MPAHDCTCVYFIQKSTGLRRIVSANTESSGLVLTVANEEHCAKAASPAPAEDLDGRCISSPVGLGKEGVGGRAEKRLVVWIEVNRRIWWKLLWPGVPLGEVGRVEPPNVLQWDLPANRSMSRHLFSGQGREME